MLATNAIAEYALATTKTICKSKAQLSGIAQILDRTGPELLKTWPDLAAQANSVELGSGYGHGGLIPTDLKSEEE